MGNPEINNLIRMFPENYNQENTRENDFKITIVNMARNSNKIEIKK